MSIYTELSDSIKHHLKHNIQVYKPTRLYIKRIRRNDDSYLYYFGKTCHPSVEMYTGSGHIWLKYITKYGKGSIEHVWNSDYYDDPAQIQLEAIKFSLENDIVNSKLWANSQIENGLDGGLLTEHSKELIRLKLKGIKRKPGSGTSNTIWVNNGNINSCIPKSTLIPEGWVKGRLRKY